MCFSALVEQDLKRLSRRLEAKVDLEAFERVFSARLENDGLRLPKALEANFLEPANAAEARIRDLIETYRARRIAVVESELFKQKKRQADAERSLVLKETKAARESLRISSSKIKLALAKLGELKSTERKASDSRIFPFHYAAIGVREQGQTWIRPMRYHCRPAGRDASIDKEKDGLYNARRDNLERFWKAQFGKTHALAVVTGFFENVAKHDFERRELAPGEAPQNLVLNFNPQPPVEMLVACLWSRWEAEGQPSLESFAAITDEPPPEVAATGHDRCIVALKESNIGAWLSPQERSWKELQDILGDRQPFYFEHRLAA